MQNLFWKPPWTSDGNCHGIPNPWNCFQAFQSPQRSSCKLFFAHFCESLLFQCSSISWEHSIVSHHVFTNVAGMTQRITLLKTFLQHLLFCWEPFWGFLHLISEHAPLFSRAVSHLVSWNFVFCTDVFCITLVVNVLRKIAHHVSCFRHYGAYYGYIWVCLEKVKTLFYEYLDFTVVVTQLIKSVESPSSLGIFGCFCPILYYVSIIAENHLTFSCKFLRSVAEICEYICISNSTYLLIFMRYCF